MKLLLLWSFVILELTDYISPVISKSESKLLLISFDGFRYDYLDAFKPKEFLKFADRGVLAKQGMLPSFPSKTFPNHYTLVTGLYPESHGIVDNTMYDVDFNENFTQRSTDTKWFDAGEPVWITARLQGRKSAVYFWVGSETTLKNTTANIFMHFNTSVPWKTRVDTVVEWLASDISFAALYFEEPDKAGHRNGSLSEGVRLQIDKLDGILAYLMEKMDAKSLTQHVDVILTSDHGMANVSHVPEENLILRQHLTPEDYVLVSQTGPVASILPRKGKAVEVRDKLNKVTSNVVVYLKEDIPEEFHYRNNRRILPLIAIAQEGFQTVGDPEDLLTAVGQHGYNNSLLSMRAMFMAAGPSFKQGLKVKPFTNVNLYPLMCHILGVKPSPNNGSLDIVRNMLLDTQHSSANSQLHHLTMDVTMVLFIVSVKGIVL